MRHTKHETHKVNPYDWQKLKSNNAKLLALDVGRMEEMWIHKIFYALLVEM